MYKLIKYGLICVCSAKAAAKKVLGVAGYSWSVPRVGHIDKEVVNPCKQSEQRVYYSLFSRPTTYWKWVPWVDLFIFPPSLP